MKNLICVSAPSGSGKTTLCKAIRRLRPDLIWSVSCTTREPRNGELDGEDYYFKTKEEFLEMIDRDEFAEWENVHGNFYGTPKSKLSESKSSSASLRQMLRDLEVRLLHYESQDRL